ncbi:MAG: hypothetical protein LBF76_00650 [Holosporales bacterium]|jgi:hypothetical protein|nr:hypothetical protein [Holosporales bacterium]
MTVKGQVFLCFTAVLGVLSVLSCNIHAMRERPLEENPLEQFAFSETQRQRILMGNPEQDRNDFANQLNSRRATEISILPPRIFGEKMKEAGYRVTRTLSEEREILRATCAFTNLRSVLLLKWGSPLAECRRMLSEIVILGKRRDTLLLRYAEGNGNTVDPIYFQDVLSRLQFLRDRIHHGE